MEEGLNVKVLEYDDLQTMSQTHWGVCDSPVRFPSDTAGWEAMSSPCRVYRLGSPMTLQELEAMPKDLQMQYLRKLRLLGATAEGVGKMLGISPARLSRWGVRFDRPNASAWAKFLQKC